MSSVKVCVRVRPFNGRERERHAALIIEMQDKTTSIANPATGRKNAFTFDHSFWTHDPADAHFANQDVVYDSIGKEMMAHAFEGYNVCIFAYGQTGAGKSYSMMGAPGPGNEGIIPRACADLFRTIGANTDPNRSFSVEVSYLEIYNEKVGPTRQGGRPPSPTTPPTPLSLPHPPCLSRCATYSTRTARAT